VVRVIEISGSNLPPVKLYVDAKNLIARQSYSAVGPDGRPLQADEVFSDYRPVNGVQVAFKAEVRRNGRTILDRVLTDVRINGSIDPQLFERPQ
jgi:hypothetical protein